MTNQDKPAFPIRQEEGGYNQNGLTKREYFAAMAMQGILSRYINNSISDETVKFASKKAVTCADELLKQLES